MYFPTRSNRSYVISSICVPYMPLQGVAHLMKSDPRENVKDLGEVSKSYASEIAGAAPTWVIQGYIIS